jgi:hypothetical protein
MDSSSYESVEATRSTKRSELVSPEVELHEFEQQSAYVEPSRQTSTVWLLFRYAKHAIEAEKRRLRKLPLEKAPVFSEVGETNSNKGILEMVTDPPGVSIVVDGQRAGVLKTPARLVGQLENGPHQLQFESEMHESEAIEIQMLPGQITRVKSILKPAKAKLRVRTHPAGATVLLDGKYFGTTPTEMELVRVGKKVEIEVTHREAEKRRETLSLVRDQVADLNWELTLKPSYLSVSTVPPGATIYWDGERLGQSPLSKRSVTAGEKTLRMEIEGQTVFEETLRLGGGEDRVLPTIHLESSEKRVLAKTETQREADAPERWVPDPSGWYGGVELGWSEATSTADLFAHQRFSIFLRKAFPLSESWDLFVDLVGAYLWGSYPGNPSVRLGGVGFGLGVGMRWRRWIYIGMEGMSLRTYRTEIQASGSSQALPVVFQGGIGPSFGLDWWWRNEPGRILSSIGFRFSQCFFGSDSNSAAGLASWYGGLRAQVGF